MCWQRLISEGTGLVSKTFSCSLFSRPLCIHSSVFSLPTCIPSRHGLLPVFAWTKTWSASRLCRLSFTRSAWISVVFVCFVEKNMSSTLAHDAEGLDLFGALTRTPARDREAHWVCGSTGTLMVSCFGSFLFSTTWVIRVKSNQLNNCVGLWFGFADAAEKQRKQKWRHNETKMKGCRKRG